MKHHDVNLFYLYLTEKLYESGDRLVLRVLLGLPAVPGLHVAAVGDLLGDVGDAVAEEGAVQEEEEHPVQV